MLQLKNITKNYVLNSDLSVQALKGVSVDFRANEFVSILGPSGCGKTTLLNIIGGLDQYTEGDLVIDGVSTKDYKDRDWDTYRNHSIGFVFQTYNLIPHQTVLQNVELALTLAGISKAERRKRAEEALAKVGLGDQLNKRPNQMSGGQMQRVAIARAIVNNPDIVLADEPTGALDTETGVQVMEILKEIANDRLVIMVTHNPELAEKYSTRIIRVLDGTIIDDSKPLTDKEFKAEKKAEQERAQAKADAATAKGRKKAKKSSMSFFTAFKLSLNNLFTKKGRTVLTSFAGSIGIIGIALILSVSQGMSAYINLVQEQTLTSYPLSIQSTAMDLTSLVASMMADDGDYSDRDDDAVYQRSIVDKIANIIDATAHTKNDLKAFKEFLEKEVADENSKLHGAIAGLQYQYDLDILVYTKKHGTNEVQKADPAELIQKVVARVLKGNASQVMGGYYSSMGTFSMNLWQELLPGLDGSTVNKLLKDQYTVEYGSWPTQANEVVLVMNEHNEISDIALYTLGLIGDEYVDEIVAQFDDDASADNASKSTKKWSYEDIIGTECKVILNSSCYKQNNDTGEWEDWRKDPLRLALLYEDAYPLKICGIIRPNPDATAHMLGGTIGYTYKLTEHIVNEALQSDVVKAQKLPENEHTDILTGLPFETSKDALTPAQKTEIFKANFSTLSNDDKLNVYGQAWAVDNAAVIEQGLDAMLEMTPYDVLLNMIASMMPGTDADSLKSMLPEDEVEAKAVIVNQVKPYLLDWYTEQAISRELARLQQSHAQDEDPVAGVMQEVEAYFSDRTEQQFAAYYDATTVFSESTLEDNLALMGCVDLSTPTVINIYASSFDAKDVIADEIARYNNEIAEDEAQQIKYTDFVALVMSAVTTIIDAVTYVLVAFVSISLIVSSIMIGVITLISVQERTKEIGILRAIGASKRDVSSIFNAETVIIGFAAGVFGVLFTYLLCIPINIILHALTGISTLNAYLPPLAALILVLISVGLTLIAGLIPSRSAAKKDPVTCLRTE